MCWIDGKNKGINPVGRPKKADKDSRHGCYYSVSYETKGYMGSRTDVNGDEIKPGVYLDYLVKQDKNVRQLGEE